ncbi:45 kDa calcium-binding protein-like [Dysidea avara]|uniref:45 kDa calcium-binding protein-like n=1 Tax=Dysidea avara TaxID=196820 RepID=UPI0033322995
MKIEILLLYLLVSRLDSVPVRDRDEDDATDERHEFGPPDHIDGLPLERDGDLNTEMDAEMFLGDRKDDEATELEARDELEEVFELADKNSDELLSLTELKEWIHSNAMKHRRDSQEYNANNFKHTDLDHNGYVEWEEYIRPIKDHIKEVLSEERKENPEVLRDGRPISLEEEFEEIFNSTEERDKHLWKMADENNDGHLDEKEFLPFQHPEHSKITIRTMVRDLIKLLDEDKDGRLSEEEFMEYYQRRSLQFDKDDKAAKERRRREFQEHVDSNQDGVADQVELEEYMDPQNMQHAFNEGMFLIEQVDDNQDGLLSLEEILNHEELFVGSRISDSISNNLGHVVHWEL